MIYKAKQVLKEKSLYKRKLWHTGKPPKATTALTQGGLRLVPVAHPGDFIEGLAGERAQTTVRRPETRTFAFQFSDSEGTFDSGHRGWHTLPDGSNSSPSFGKSNELSSTL